MRRRASIGLLVVALCAAVAAPARAGTYDVHACSTSGGKFPNRSWTFSVPASGFATAQSCPTNVARPELTLLIPADSAMPAGHAASMTFSAPSGAAIRDFALTRQIYYYNPVRDSGTSPPYILYSFGNLAFSGVGEYDPATRDAINGAAPSQWYNYPSGAADTGAPTVTRADFPRLASAGNAASLTITAGCWTNPCSLRGDGTVFSAVFGARVTITDSSAPRITAVQPTGLFGDGSHGGDDAVTFSATDNVGIRRAEIIDLTNPNAPRVAAREDYSCDYSRPRPCTDQSGDSIAASPALPSGLRTLALLVMDTAGNVTTTAPRGVLVGGPLNGSNAGGQARLKAVFRSTGRTRRTIRAGQSPTIAVSLVNAAGQGIGGARLQLRTRDLRTGARYLTRDAVTTGADGLASFKLPAGPSREIRLEYRTRVDDPTPSTRVQLRLGVRPRATLHVRPRRVANGGSIRLFGSVRSRPLPKPGKLIVLQAFERGRWRTFATTRTRRGGRYARRYRFTRTFRPRSFRFRARLPREGAYPYSTGYSGRVRVRVG